MKKNAKRKLRLSPESIATLSAADLRAAAGGGSDACTTESPKSLCLQGCNTGNPC